MKIKFLLPVLGLSLLLAGCGPQKTQTPTANTPGGLTTKLLINELPLKDRPFTVLVPHATNRLFTFAAVNANNAKTASLDIEYQSKDLLKNFKATLESPIANPYVKAIILGSCSTGGKCDFDTDLKAGTTKFKLSYEGQDAIHVLKGDFTFVTGQKNLPDGKVIFEPTKATLKENMILMNSFGFPKPVDKESLLYPIVISSASDKAVAGTLTVNQAGVTGALIYDGTEYQTIKFTTKDNSLVFTLNQKPWLMSTEITRDDQKGVKESIKLYLVGPIVLLK